MSTERIVFNQAGDFQATYAAEDWCARNGISVGFMQGREPRGLLKGDFLIAKWRNLTTDERAELYGTMTTPGSSPRAGPVVIELKGTRKAVKGTT